MRAMSKPDRSDFRRVGAVPVDPLPPFAQTFRGRVVLVLLCVGLLTLAYAPFKQFYCAWVALAPWLVLVGNAPTKKSAFFWSWLTGITFFSVNMWWVAFVTLPGAMGLVLYLGFWFGVSALVIRGAGLLEVGDGASPQPAWRPVAAVVLIATIWAAQEWIRGNLFTGLPWLYVGHTQTPVLAMCQVADLTGAYGVTFWVVLINAWVALFVLHRLNPARLIAAGVLVVAVLGATLAYGLFRMGQRTSYPGPSVLVVQPNYPQSNTGAKGASLDEIVDFHVTATTDYLKRLPPGGQAPDLVAWSETMMPELNPEYRRYAYNLVFAEDKRVVGEYLDGLSDTLGRLAKTYGTNLIVGGHTMLPDREVLGKPRWLRRNSAFYYERTGEQSRLRYDKIHLVPFGEYMPFRESFPLLFQFFNLFNPYKGGEYTVEAGTELTVFPLPAKAAVAPATGATTGPTTTGPTSGPSESADFKFVTAICFEDVDSRLMARAFAGPDGGKRADFIVNLTNDGWFAWNQMPQHMQLAVFRSIENRVPTARSVNTGVSGFIDPVGRVYDAIPVHTTGTRAAPLTLDRRVAPYTHLGDVFAGVCLTVSGAVVAAGIGNRLKNRRSGRR
jgi:apolipoprotein N-acyltransferase